VFTKRTVPPSSVEKPPNGLSYHGLINKKKIPILENKEPGTLKRE